MKKKLTFRSRHMTIAAATVLIAGMIAPLSAQAFENGNPEEVTIMGHRPQVDRFDTGKRGNATGAPMEEVTTTRQVSYADLNLRSRHDMREFKMRLAGAARSACYQLGGLFPQNNYPGDSELDAKCVRDAVADGMDQIALFMHPSRVSYVVPSRKLAPPVLYDF